MKMRDPFESLIPLNGCKGTYFPPNYQIFLEKYYFFLHFRPYWALSSPRSSPFARILRRIGARIDDIAILRK